MPSEPKPKAAPKPKGPSPTELLKEELKRKDAALELTVSRYGALRQFVEDHYGTGVLAVFDSQR
jgi:hypothetical protein